MFPLNNNTNNYVHPSFSQTYFNQSSSISSSLFGHGSDTNFFQHYHHHFPPGQFLLACVPETTPTMAASPAIDSTNLVPERHIRKDRHSKIYTSHGLRDRRVRLSIGIARQFFDLQELLGFDKASNTIEWLLIKSRRAIRKLAETKASSTGEANSEYEMFSESNEELDEESDQEGLVLKSKSVIEASEEEMKKSQKATMQLLVKESRAKARTRAKERTREKIYTRKLSEIEDSHEVILNQARTTSGERLKAIAEFETNLRTNDQVPRIDTTKPTTSLNYQQNWMLTKDLNSNSCMPSNWDNNSSFAALSSINSFNEHQNYGKPRESSQ